MPNGGSDCCATCWFNPKARAKLENGPVAPSIRDFCEIRKLEIDRPYWTYCANHPHRSKSPDRIPIGPVWSGHDAHRQIWKPSPDTEDSRRHLLELLALIRERPTPEYPIGVYRDEVIVWQLGEFAEARGVPGLRRITKFDPRASTNAADGPLVRTRERLVELAQEALRKIERASALRPPGERSS